MHRPELPAFALAALAVTATVVLIMTNHPVPDWIAALGIGAGAGGLGAAVPRTSP